MMSSDRVLPVGEHPQLIVLTGLPGAGKTTVATWLSDHHGYAIASRDVIRAAMFPSCRFTEEEKQAAYGAMKNAVEIMLEQGHKVVTDGMCFSSNLQLAEITRIAESMAAPVNVLHCSCPVTIAQERVERDRINDPTVPADRDARLVQLVHDRFDELPPRTLVIDTSQPTTLVRSELTQLLDLETRP